MKDHNIKFYIVNAYDIAGKLGLGGRINMVMQTVFFKLADIIPVEDAVKYTKEAIQKSYGSKGEKIVKMNWDAVDHSLDAAVQIDVNKLVDDGEVEAQDVEGFKPDFIKNILEVINRQQGDMLPVSAFAGSEDGTFPQGTAAWEKRGIAISLPQWSVENCIQCNQCALVCPHAVIRPYLLNSEEKENAPDSFETKPALGKELKGLEYKIQISPLDCTGCGVCAQTCPAKQKALIMKPFGEIVDVEKENYEYATKKVTSKTDLMDRFSLKGSQFQTPLMEFSGACAGCGETAYAKLITQLFGDRMLIANATGCSSIWGGSAPSTPYTTDCNGCGPAWANSLFEDNAEYGYGMFLGVAQIREKLADWANELISENINDGLTEALKKWVEVKELGDESKAATAALIPLLEEFKSNKTVYEILNKKEFLVKKSQWVFGGDGWAYDIGFGGLDHVIASGEDVNILVFDTEVYSNTGGQSSKSTPTAAVAKFAASGKKIRKKDLGRMAMTYGYVYVAQISLGANMNQTMKAIKEAEAYPGPSLIIAYSPCINHGIKGGMTNSGLQQKKAVEAGYWHLYRYNPLLKEEGKNPFVLDSKEPTESFIDFIGSEVRYTSLKNTFPEIAKEYFGKADIDAKEKYAIYKKMAE